jgi:hypothetical protein
MCPVLGLMHSLSFRKTAAVTHLALANSLMLL